MKALHMVAFILVAVGGLNWGMVGLGSLVAGADWNIVAKILGSWPQVESIVYLLVGLSTVWLIIGHKKECRMCMGGGNSM